MNTKTTTTIITALLLLAMVSGAVAQEKWEYAVVAYDVSFAKIRISEGGVYQVLDADKLGQKKGDDYTAVLKKVSEMEDKGWELYQSSAGDNLGVVFFFRKKRQQ